MSSERLLHETTSLCQHCKNAVPARVVASDDNGVWMHKVCTTHGAQRVQLSNNAEWYEKTRAITPRRTPPQKAKQPVELGCPFDCGPCESHTQKVRLPVVTITSACNLDCPICYVYNKNEDAFHMGTEEFGKILDHLQRDHGSELDVVNLTGGEPTLHPQFLDFLELAHEKGIHRVTICSNGIRLAKEEALVKRLGELRARVALSFDSFETDADFVLQGAHLLEIKTRCMDLLEKYDVDTTLIPVMTRGINDHEIGAIIEYGLQKKNVRHLEIHTMTYTGQSGVSFQQEDRSGRISMYEVLERIEQTTGGFLTPDDWVPSPCAHPLCYQIAYLLLDPEGGKPIPFTRFMPKEALYEALADRLYLEPTPALERVLKESIDRLWSEDGDERTLRLLKRLLLEMFPQGKTLSREAALRVSERAIKAVYIHSHMDEETFDAERTAECCDSNCYADGRTVPVCNYNILYREKEAHFMTKPVNWNERSGGQKTFRASLPIVTG